MKRTIQDTQKFYSAIASFYDQRAGYAEPMDSGLREMRRKIKIRHQRYLKGHAVLEIACGTGFWTKAIAKTARSVLATDGSKKMISIAKQNLIKYKNVDIKRSDAYSLNSIGGPFTAVYAHWWWSHMPKSKIRSFLLNLHEKLVPGAFVFFGDHLPHYTNRKTRIIYNKDGDRIEVRKLENRRKYYVIKNFPTQSEIKQYLAGIAKDIKFKKYRGSWELRYRVEK